MRVFNKIFAGTFDDWFEVSWVEEVQRPSPLFTLERFSKLDIYCRFPKLSFSDPRQYGSIVVRRKPE